MRGKNISIYNKRLLTDLKPQRDTVDLYRVVLVYCNIL